MSPSGKSEYVNIYGQSREEDTIYVLEKNYPGDDFCISFLSAYKKTG